MLDLLAAATAFTVLVALACVLVVAVAVVPFVLAGSMAQRRAFSATRWCGVTVLGAGVGAALAYLLWTRTGLPWPLALLPLLLGWSGPGAVWLLEGSEERIGGRAGRHE